jgi:hypothetical protein
MARKELMVAAKMRFTMKIRLGSQGGKTGALYSASVRKFVTACDTFFSALALCLNVILRSKLVAPSLVVAFGRPVSHPSGKSGGGVAAIILRQTNDSRDVFGPKARTGISVGG